MPIGVPKVEYRLPGEPEADWIDLYNCLYRERMLFLCQDLGDEVANQLISLMLYLNAEDPSQPFFMYINSLGGSVTCGIGVYDIMRYLQSGITTICMGTASSMASFVLAGGTYGRRLSLPNGRIMIHQPEGGSDGQASEILSESSEVNRIRKQIGLIYATRTQQSIERIARDMDRDQFMSADEAKSYGLIDFVARTSSEPNVDLGILKLLNNEPNGPQQFRELASAQSMEQAQEAIRNLPESANGGFEPFKTFGPENGFASEAQKKAAAEAAAKQAATKQLREDMKVIPMTRDIPINDTPTEDPEVILWSDLADISDVAIDTALPSDPDEELQLFAPNVLVVVDGGILLSPYKTMNQGSELLPRELPPKFRTADAGNGAQLVTDENVDVSFVVQEIDSVHTSDEE